MLIYNFSKNKNKNLAISRIAVNDTYTYILPKNLDSPILNKHKCHRMNLSRIYVNIYHSSGPRGRSDNRRQHRGSHEVASINAGCLNWFSCLNSYVFSNWVRLRVALQEAQYWIAQYIGWKHLCAMLLCRTSTSYS